MLHLLLDAVRRTTVRAPQATAGLLGVLAVLLREAWQAAQGAVEQHVLPPSARVATAEPPRSLRGRTARGAREIAVCAAVVLLLGMGAAGATQPSGPAQVAVTAGATMPTDLHDRPVPRPPAPPEQAGPGEARAEARALPPELRPPTTAPAPVTEAPAQAAEPAAPPVPSRPQRWLPTGTGMWLHDWTLSEGGNADAVVAKAKAGGFSHLYVQTGSTKKGWIGEPVLSSLLPATKGLGVKVIAWDFPKLIDPEADAQRMADAATWSRPGVPRVAAVAPDVETAAEGTHVSPESVTRYYSTLRRLLPDDIAVLATVPWPSEKRIGKYPYHSTDPWTDAWIPMAYWYNRSPRDVTSASMQWLAGFGKPVMPVGQGYDGRLDAPYLPEDPDPAGSVQAFVDAARAGGARSISLWSWQTTGVPQWQVLVGASAQEWPAP